MQIDTEVELISLHYFDVPISSGLIALTDSLALDTMIIPQARRPSLYITEALQEYITHDHVSMP